MTSPEEDRNFPGVTAEVRGALSPLRGLTQAQLSLLLVALWSSLSLLTSDLRKLPQVKERWPDTWPCVLGTPISKADPQTLDIETRDCPGPLKPVL